MSANPIDLTTLAAVKAWIQIATGTTSDDSIIQDCITAFSAYILHLTGRGPSNGTVPTASPFVAPQSYDEFYDGTGTDLLQLRNWPITAVAAVNVEGHALQQSTAPGIFGWVVNGDAKFIGIRGGGYSFQRNRYAGGYAGCGGFNAGMQNVEVQYTAGFTGVPFDLEMAARKTVGLNYKRRGWISQKSQAMAAGAGTVSYGQWEMDADTIRVIDYYKARG